MPKIIDISGQRFGRLVVIKNVPKPKDSKSETSFWLCKCDCGKYKIAGKASLKNGNTKSCGCLQIETNHKRMLEINQKKKKYNQYKIEGEKTIIFIRDGTYFTIDTSDKDCILKYYWDVCDGYISTQIRTKENNKLITRKRRVHQLLFPNIPKGLEVDHIDRDKRNNTRKNLRIVTHKENMQNVGMFKSNKSGYKNISFDKEEKKYLVVFSWNYKRYFVGRFSNIEDAQKALLKRKKEIGAN